MREYGFATFGVRDYRTLSTWLTEQARGTDNGLALGTLLISEVRGRRIVVPTLPVVERLAVTCRARARREAYAVLCADLTLEQRSQLDGLLETRGEHGRRIWAGCGSRLGPQIRHGTCTAPQTTAVD